jgi:uncharacterized membrane protein
MDKVIAVVFNNETRAYEGLRALRELHHDGHITLYDDAVVVKDASGKVATREVRDGSVGTVVGLPTGSLVGVLGGPSALQSGREWARWPAPAFDLSRAGINADFVDEIARFIASGNGSSDR